MSEGWYVTVTVSRKFVVVFLATFDIYIWLRVAYDVVCWGYVGKCILT